VIRFLYTLCFMASSVGIGALQAQPNARPAQKLYIINTAGDDVTVTDVATNKVLGRIEVGPRPHGIAASAAGDLLLVTVEGGKGELVWIDPATDKVVRRLRTGSAPNQLAVTPDGKFAFVPVSGGNYEVVDVAQAKIIDKIFTGGQPHNTVCSADGQRMYLAPIGNPKKVTIVDVASRKVLGEIPFSNSVRPVAITKDEKKFFAQVDGLVGIEMADVAARKMIHRVPAEIPPELKKISSRSHGLGIRPGDKEVWDCDVERKVVHVYDITGEKPRQTATIPIGGTVYWLTFGPDGKYCYVSVRSKNEVAVVDTATREVVARIPTGKEPKRLLVVEMRGATTAQTPKKPPTQQERINKVRTDLKNPQAEIRRAAILSLVHSDLSATLREEIQEDLKDKDAEVRAAAATATGNLGAAAVPAVSALIGQLQNDPSKEARETAARALGRIGKASKDERRAVPHLRTSAAKDADPVTRVVALSALAMMDVDVGEQVAALRKFLHDENPLVRMKAAHGLGMIGSAAKVAAPEIVTVLEHATDAHHRGYIARALGNTGDPASLPALYKALRNETDPGARGEIQGAIARLGGKAPQM
jgi:YVTN family beta-propeller protein